MIASFLLTASRSSDIEKLGWACLVKVMCRGMTRLGL
jgi:hypothetical protein